MCCTMQPAPWWSAVEAELKAGCLGVLKLLSKNRKVYAMLKSSPSKRCSITSPLDSLLSHKNEEPTSPKAHDRIESLLCLSNVQSSVNCEANDKLLLITQGDSVNDTDDAAAVQKLDSPNDSLKDKTVSSVSPEESEANSDVPYDVWREKYNLKECSVRVKDCISGDAERTLIPMNVEIQCLDLAESTAAGDQKLSYKSQPLSTPKSDSGISSTDEELKTADDSKDRNLEFQSLQLISCGDKNNVTEQDSIGERPESQQIPDETPHKPTVTLLSIKNKVNANEYTTLVQFHNEMENVLNGLNCSDLLSMYHHNLQEVFPWFNAKCACASDKPLHEDKMQVKRSKKLSDKPVNKDNLSTDVSILDESFQKFPVDMSGKSLDDFYSGYTVEDKRICVLCKGIGDGIPNEEGRLLYCGQNEWAHTNCALWSAEVFEEIDGSLQNVHSAVSRGRQMRCEHCGKRGASVGCCAKNCPESYHFSCARKAKCTFMDDKNVYCPTHTKEATGKVLQEDSEFDIRRPIYVELDRKKKKYTDPRKVRLMIGSFSLENIGTYVNEISDTVDAIIPNDFQCTRLFWSTVEPWRIVQYHIKTTLHTENSKDSHDYGKNFTIDHSLGNEVVEQKMNEILLWHKELNLKQYGPSKEFTSSQSYSVAKVKHVMSIVDSKHTIPYLNTENTAMHVNKIVRQVLNDIVDTICSKEPDESCLSDSQTANDLLPPELKDAIFEDLPHDLLDGISMQDILPKLMIYEDMVSLDRGDGYYFSDVSKDEREANAAILNCETEVSIKTSTDSSKLDKLDDESSQNSLWNQFNKIDSDNSIEKCSSFRGKRRELKRSKSEVFTDVFSPSVSTCSRKPKRSCSLTWNCKLDAAISSTYKRRKARAGSKHVGEGASNIVMVVDANSDKAHMLQELSLPVSMSRTSTSGISPAPVETVRDLKSRLEDDCGVGDARKRSSHPKEEGKENKCLVWHSRSQPRILQLDGTVDSLSSSGSEGGSSPHSADERSMCAACKGRLNSINSMGLCSTCCSKTAVFIKCNDKKLKQDVEEEPVRCDRCHCTYRTRVSFERHLPMCSSDYILSTSESDSENTRSSEEDCSKGTNFTILNQSDTKVQHTVETQTISKSIQTLSVHTQTQVQTSTVSFRPRNRSISKVMTHRNVSRNNVTISNNQASQYNQIHHLPPNTHPNQTQNAPTIIIQQVPSANVVPTFVEAFQQQTGQSLQFIATIDSQPNDVHEQAFITGQATNPVMSTFHLQSSTDNLSGLRNGGISVVPSVQITAPQPTLPILGIINAQPQPNGLDCCCDLVSTEQILPSFNMYENHSRGIYYPSHQPFYVSNYETVVSNTVMSSSHLVSGPVSGMVAASSSISSTTTQVFQASKVPSILEYEIIQPSTYNYVVNQPQFTNATVRNTEIFVNNPAPTSNGPSGVQKFPSQQTMSTNNRHKCFTLETVNTDHTYTHGNSETYIAVYPNTTKPSISVDKSYRSVSLETDECIQSRVKDVTTQTELASKINGHIFPAESKSHMVTSNVNTRNKIQTVSIKNGQNSLDALTKKTQITLPVTNGINNSNPQSPLKLVFQKQARDGIYKISSHNGAVKLVNAKRIVSLPISSVPVKTVTLQKCDISSTDDLAVEKPKTMPTDISHTKMLKNCENEVKLIKNQTSYEQIPNQEHEIRKSHPHLTYEIQSQDGFTCSSTSFSDAWQQVFKAVQKARGTNKMVPVPQNAFNGKQESLQMLGLKHNAFRYLVEQLPGVNRCIKYKLRYHKRHDLQSDDDDFNLYLQPNRTGCARTEKFLTRAAYDMFSWLASAHRNPPKFIQQAEGEVVGNRYVSYM